MIRKTIRDFFLTSNATIESLKAFKYARFSLISISVVSAIIITNIDNYGLRSIERQLASLNTIALENENIKSTNYFAMITPEFRGESVMLQVPSQLVELRDYDLDRNYGSHGNSSNYIFLEHHEIISKKNNNKAEAYLLCALLSWHQKDLRKTRFYLSLCLDVIDQQIKEGDESSVKFNNDVAALLRNLKS